LWYKCCVDKQLAFVLSGGGSRGALQVGALYALLESGFQPDLLVGTSIGAANAAFIALHGFSKPSLDMLTAVWRSVVTMDLLPTNYVRLTVRAMFGRSAYDPSRRIRDFLIAHGLTPELCFSDLEYSRLVIISSDLNSGTPVLHGTQPDEEVLDALLLSTALPPWFMPVKKQDRYLMDGGVESNLPIEPAIKSGATHIVALDLTDIRSLFNGREGLGGFLDRLLIAVEKRQSDLELELAKARGIPILHLGLIGEAPVPLWDFHHTEALIAQGYEIARRAIDEQDHFNP
jgi:NTE family protein